MIENQPISFQISGGNTRHRLVDTFYGLVVQYSNKQIQEDKETGEYQ